MKKILDWLLGRKKEQMKPEIRMHPARRYTEAVPHHLRKVPNRPVRLSASPQAKAADVDDDFIMRQAQTAMMYTEAQIIHDLTPNYCDAPSYDSGSSSDSSSGSSCDSGSSGGSE